ncbi:MAG: hypothetical protein ABJE95_00910 [Byssovorax sp.]
MDHGQESRSSLAPGRLLRATTDGDGNAAVVAEVVKTRGKSSMLFPLSTGRRSQRTDTIAKLHALSQGVIPANAWGTTKREVANSAGTAR